MVLFYQNFRAALLLFLILLVPSLVYGGLFGRDNSLFGRNHSQSDSSNPSDTSAIEIPFEATDDWIVPGDESDAVFKPGHRKGTEKEAIYRKGILKGDDSKAVFLNELPQGAIIIKDGEKLALDNDMEGERVVPRTGQAAPGRVEPGLYDGTKEGGKEIWALENFLKKDGAQFRFLDNRVFTSFVKTITHKEPKWKWGSLTTEKVKLEVRWHKVKMGNKIIEKRVGSATIKKPTEDFEIIRKMKSDEGQPPTMMNVRCPVYERVLVPEYQKYEVPAYKWEKTQIGTYRQSSFLAWVKHYRMVKRKHIVWKYWGTFDDFVSKYPKQEVLAYRAKNVTKRVLSERQMFLINRPLGADSDFASFVSEKKPTKDLKLEFLINEKKKSVESDVMEFTEHNVPSSEIVAISKK